MEIKLKNWNFENQKLSLEIGKLKFQELRTKFGNWNFEKLFKYEILTINKQNNNNNENNND